MPPTQSNRIGAGIDFEGGQSTLELLRDIRREMQYVIQLSSQVKPFKAPRSRSDMVAEQRQTNEAQLELFQGGIQKQGELFKRGELQFQRIIEEGGQKRRGIRQSQMTREEADERAHTSRIEKLRQQNDYRQQTAANENSPQMQAKFEAERRQRIQEEADERNRRIRDEKYFIESFNRRKAAEAQAANDRLKHEQEINRQIEADRVTAARRTAAQVSRVEDEELAALRAANSRTAPGAVGNSKRALDNSPERAERLRLQQERLQQELFDAEVGTAAKATLDRNRDKLIGYQNTLGRSRLQTDDTKSLQNDLRALQNRAFELRNELDKPANIRRTKESIVADLKAVEAEFVMAEQKFRRFRETTAGVSGGGPPTPPNLNGPGGRPAFNERGFFTSADVIARISRNILLYQAVSQSTYGLIDYIKTGIQAARTADDFGRALEFASKASQSNTENNFRLANSLRNLGASRQEGRAAVTEAARFTEGIDTDPTKLLNVAANIAASRGEGIDKTDELIEQLRRGESKFFKRQFGKTVEELYREEGERRAIPDNKVRIEDSNKGIKSDKEAVDAYVASLTEAQKERIRYNFIIGQSDKFEGEAARRGQELAGRIDTLVNRFKDGQEGVGQFITEIKSLNALAEGLINTFDALAVSSSRLKRTGSGGTISDSDITEFANAKTGGFRGASLRAIDNVLIPGAELAVSAGLLGFLGRRKATQETKIQAYDTDYAKGLIDFEGQTAAASQRAKQVAEAAKPGLLRSVTTGMNRVTNGLNETITDYLKIPTSLKFTPERFATQKTPGYGEGNFADYNLSDVRPENREYFQNKFDAIEVARNESIAAGRRNGGIAGGLVGGAVGAEIGSLIARSIDAGPITTAGITVLGGIAGSSIGTAAGSAAGGAIAAQATAAGGYGALLTAAAPLAIPLAAAIVAAGVATKYNDLEQRNLTRENTISGLYGQQQSERLKAQREGRILRTSLDTGIEYTDAEMRAAVASGRENANAFFRIVRAVSSTGQELTDRYGNVVTTLVDNVRILTEAELKAKQERQVVFGRPLTNEEQAEYDTLRAQRQQQINDPNFKFGNSSELERLRQLDSIRNGQPGLKAGGDEELFARGLEYDLKQRQAAKQREEQAEQDRINQQASALGKLREAATGSFRLVGEIAQGQTGPDNPFTKVLSDQATIIDRMREQWSFLGEEAVKYFSELERRNNNVQIMKVSFESLGRQLQLVNSIEQERDERTGPGLSRNQEQAGSIFNAAAEAARLIPELRRREIEINGGSIRGTRYEEPDFIVKEQINRLGTAFLTGIGKGGIDRQISALYSQQVLDVTNGLSGRQIANSPYLRERVGDAIRIQRREAEFKIEDEIQKLNLNRREDARLSRDLAGGSQLQRELLAQGYDAQQAQRIADQYTIGRTDNVAAKDLTFDQFAQRQAAQRREADATALERRDAKAAVEKGLLYQEKMSEELRIIREAILGGDVSMLIQVSNDTQARIDQNALKDTNSVGYNVPGGSRTNQNPYSGQFNIYGRGGRKR